LANSVSACRTSRLEIADTLRRRQHRGPSPAIFDGSASSLPRITIKARCQQSITAARYQLALAPLYLKAAQLGQVLLLLGSGD